MGFFSSDQKITQTTQLSDYRTGAEGSESAIALGVNSQGNTLNIGSDDVSKAAIDASNDALIVASNFLRDTFTEFLNTSSKAQERADNNIAANQQLTSELLKKEQETSDDRLIKIVTYGLVAVVGIYLIQSGTLKSFVGIIK